VTEKELLKQLEQRRIENGWSDKQMADELQCARTTYLGTRAGELPIGMKIVRGIARRFPDMRDALFSYLSGGLDMPRT